LLLPSHNSNNKPESSVKMTQEKNNSGSGHAGRFVRACRRLPVDRTPVWFLRQAGRYMPEYMEVRKHQSLLDICRAPELAAEVTITAPERLSVDAAIIFADLLLPVTPWDWISSSFMAKALSSTISCALGTDQVALDRPDRGPFVCRVIDRKEGPSMSSESSTSSVRRLLSRATLSRQWMTRLRRGEEADVQ